MRRVVIVAASAGTAVGLLRFGYKVLDLRLVGSRIPAVVPLVEELTAAWMAVFLLVACIPLLRRARQRVGGAIERAAMHLALAAGFSAAHTTLNWAGRELVFGVLGRSYSYGRMPDRYAMELPMDVIVYALFASGLYVMDRLGEARSREVEAVELRARLLETQLRELRAQVEPHFLFNSLNVISETMYEAPRKADEMISHLSDVLRSSLRSSDAQQLTLSRELEQVSHYLALLRARFGDRLTITTHVEDDARDCLVPSMVLQPLVENAIQHGSSDGSALSITIRGTRRGARLHLEVTDNGRALPGESTATERIGLGGTRARLRLLHGGDATFAAGPGANGGFAVRMELPAVTVT